MANKRLLTRVKDSLSELDLPYFKKEAVTEIRRYEDMKTFRLDFDIPFHSMQLLVEFCKNNHSNLAFNKTYLTVELTVFEPSKFALVSEGEQNG